MTSTVYQQTLPDQTAKLVSRLNSLKPTFLDQFYLSGGTGLSLQLGHRESEDLDFFSQSEFSPLALQIKLEQFGALEKTEIADGTLNTYLSGVKLQFLYYPYKLLEETTEWSGIKLSSVLDIACTKLQTIGSRGSKKDFIDLFFLFQQFSLTELLEALKRKYPASDYSQTHILKSLTYFADAQDQPMPRMHKNVSWEKVEQKMIEVVKRIDFGRL